MFESLDKNGSLILGIAGGLIVIASAIWQWKEKNSSDKEAKISQDSLKILNQKILNTAEELAGAYKENANLERIRADELIRKTNELAESSKENARLQEELKNQITGGNTKPTLEIFSYKHNRTDFDFYVVLFDIINHGKYPLKNLKAIVSDMWGYISAPYLEISRVGSSFRGGPPLHPNYDPHDWEINKTFNVGTLIPNNKYPLYSAVYSNDRKLWGKSTQVDNTFKHDKVNYVVEISWDGGKLIYYLTATVINNKLELTKYEASLNGQNFNAVNNIKFESRSLL